MKNILKVSILFLILITMIVSISFATGLEDIEMTEDQKEILNLMKDPTDDKVVSDLKEINSDLFLAEESISVEENVNGNLYLVGEIVNVTSENIDGNVFIVGNNVTINSNIEGSIYALATNLTIYGNVEDVYAISENINVLENMNCRDLKILGTNINIAGVINRDLYAAGGQVEIADTGKVNGVLSTSEEVLGNVENVNEVNIIEDTTTVDFEKNEEQMQKIGKTILNGISAFFFIAAEMTGMIIIALIVLLTSKKKIQTSNFKEEGLMDTVYGLVYFGLAIGIIIALMFTIIGIPVSILVSLVLWFVFWKITIPVASIEIAKAILKSETKSKVLVWFIAFIVFTLAQSAAFIPSVGGLIKGLVSLYGFGYMIRNVIRKNKADDSEIEILG